jgi:hypothetical protein
MRWLLVLLMFVAILALFYWLALASPWSGAFVSGGRIVRRGGSRNACGRAAAGYGEWMGGFHAPGRAMAVIVCGVLLLPLCAVPLYAAGSYVARGADTDPSNGVFQLGLILGVGIPAITAISLGRLSPRGSGLPRWRSAS